MVIKKQLRPYIPLVVSLLLGLVLFYLVDDFVVNIIILPLMKVVWFLSLIVQSLPQAVIWIVSVLVLLIITIASLTKGEKTAKTFYRMSRANTGSVELWARLIENAQRSVYSKWRLAQKLKRLTWKLLSPIDNQQTINYDLSGVELPEEIRVYYEAQHPFNRSFRERFNPKNKETDLALELDPEVVLQYLKERLNL
jgi:hypothetical protein